MTPYPDFNNDWPNDMRIAWLANYPRQQAVGNVDCPDCPDLKTRIADAVAEQTRLQVESSNHAAVAETLRRQCDSVHQDLNTAYGRALGAISIAVDKIDGQGNNTPWQDVVARIEAIGAQRDDLRAALADLTTERDELAALARLPPGWRCVDGCASKANPEPWCDNLGGHI
jgi:hypothetical protein